MSEVEAKKPIKDKIKAVAVNASQSVVHLVNGNPITAITLGLAAITGIVLILKNRKK
jgi:hypothetical protein